MNDYLVSEMTDRYIATNLHTRNSENDRTMLPFAAEAGIKELEAHKKFRSEFPKLRQKLRNEIRQILLAENSNSQLEKKQ